MKNLALLGLSVVILLSLDSCSSGKKSYERGNYYQSVLESTNRLRRSPNNKKARETLRYAYPLAVETKEQDIRNAMSSNANFKYRTVLSYYIELNNMHDQIRRSPGALSVIREPKNYYNKLEEARQLAAQESYDKGLEALSRNDREEAKLAYGLFGYSLQTVPNFKDAYDLQQKAREMATLHVLVAQTPLPASFSLSGDYFQNKIEEFVNAQGDQLEFIAFYNEGENVNPDFQPDHIIRMQFDEFSIGNVYLKETSKEYTRDSVVLASVQRGNGSQVGNNYTDQGGGRTRPDTGNYNPERTGGNNDSGNNNPQPGNNNSGNSGNNNSGNNGNNNSGNNGNNNSGNNGNNNSGNNGNNNSGNNGNNNSGNNGNNNSGNNGNNNSGNNGNPNPGNSDKGSEKVEICHKAGNSGKFNTITISTSALQAHLNHGDKIGPCAGGSSASGKKAGKSNVIVPYTVVSEDGGTEDIYGTVKATLTTFTKTLTSNGLMSMQIVDARTNKILREQKYPGEFIWETTWGYFNGDERALTEEQIEMTGRKEVDEPTRDEMFAFLSKPIFARVTTDLQTYYKDY